MKKAFARGEEYRGKGSSIFVFKKFWSSRVVSVCTGLTNFGQSNKILQDGETEAQRKE